MNPEIAADSLNRPDFIPDRPKSYETIYSLFQHAISHRLKYPRITLQASDGTVVILRVAGGKSRFPGQIQILSEGQYGLDQLFFGRINQSGTLFPAAEMTSRVQKLLDDLSADPLKVAFEYGRATGCCCFCRLPLTDARSASHGYGPVCAKHYGLQWNATRESNGFQGPAPESDVVILGGLQ